jgi:predicted nucleic acid-binding protein
MAFRVFLDAGILLDLTLKRPKYESARKLVQWVMEGRIEAYVTPAVIQETARWLKKAYGAVRAKELLLALLAEVLVIDGGHTVAVSALHSDMSDMDEALSYYTALHHKLDYFITRDEDLSRAAIPVLPVCTPEEFLKSNP